mgnify:CR=1 FL=1
MSTIRINKQLCNLCGDCIKFCPFGAMEQINGEIQINASCKMCKLCIKSCPQNAINFEITFVEQVDKSDWKGILIYVEHDEGNIHPVTYELIGKARELMKTTGQKVYAIFIGNQIHEQAKELLFYGVEKVFVYDSEELKHFRVDIYANAVEDCINSLKPSVVLIGATSVGRSLAPRVATRFRTGLTADCTTLEMRENTDLVQIRPAFGGNIMAQILTQNHRPQFATVRYKVMDAAPRAEHATGTIEECILPAHKLQSEITIKSVYKREEQIGITDAQVLVVAGRGIKSKQDLAMIEELASLLGGQIAATRPLIEQGWVNYKRQIGLSGRTVKPKLIITCGVSGAIQFVAGMEKAEQIMAINIDADAPIFSVANYGFIGDLYIIIPQLIDLIKGGIDVAI